MEKGIRSVIITGFILSLIGVFIGIGNLAMKDADLSKYETKGSTLLDSSSGWQNDYAQFIGLKDYEIELSEKDINGWLSWSLKLPPEIKLGSGNVKARISKPMVSIKDDQLNVIVPIKFESGVNRKKTIYWIEEGSFVRTMNGYQWKPKQISIGKAKLPFASLWGRRYLDDFVQTFKRPQQADDFITSWKRVTKVKIVDHQLILSNEMI